LDPKGFRDLSVDPEFGGKHFSSLDTRRSTTDDDGGRRAEMMVNKDKGCQMCYPLTLLGN
jgi:hypothetical protein